MEVSIHNLIGLVRDTTVLCGEGHITSPGHIKEWFKGVKRIKVLELIAMKRSPAPRTECIFVYF